MAYAVSVYICVEKTGNSSYYIDIMSEKAFGHKGMSEFPSAEEFLLVYIKITILICKVQLEECLIIFICFYFAVAGNAGIAFTGLY